MDREIPLSAETKVDVKVDEHDRARLVLAQPSADDVVITGDRYQLHAMIIEADKQLSRWARRF